MFNGSHTQAPRVINVDKNAAYPPAIAQLKADERLITRNHRITAGQISEQFTEAGALLYQVTDKIGNKIWFI